MNGGHGPRSASYSVLIFIASAEHGASVRTERSNGTDPLIRVCGISVRGNRITKDRIILREMVLQEGDTHAQQRVLREVGTQPAEPDEHGALQHRDRYCRCTSIATTVMVEVTVNERWYLWPSIIFDLADPNFNTWWLTKDFAV